MVVQEKTDKEELVPVGYMIRDVETGLYASINGWQKDRGKIWSKIGHLKTHVGRTAKHVKKYKNAVIVPLYDIGDTTPVKDLRQYMELIAKKL